MNNKNFDVKKYGMPLNNDTKEFLAFVDTLTNPERKELRDFYQAAMRGQGWFVPANLVYNYNTQEWI